MAGWEEGLFPSQRSIDELGLAGLEEERRLAYVGITRARKRLFITFAANRQIHGLWQGSIPSRFISELPKQNLNENIEGNLGADASSYSQIEFDDSRTNISYGPGYFRAKQNKINRIVYFKFRIIKRLKGRQTKARRCMLPSSKCHSRLNFKGNFFTFRNIHSRI